MKKRKLFILLLLAAIGFAGEANGFTVSNTSDIGAGSLRQAITDLNTSGVPGTINFTTGGTFTLTSGGLPTLSSPASFVTGGSPVTVSFSTALADTRLMTLAPNVGVSLADPNLTLSMTSSANGSAALYSAGNLVISGSLAADLNETSTNAALYQVRSSGIYAGGSLTMGDMAPASSITVNSKAGAYGIYANGTFTAGNLGGVISATSESGTNSSANAPAALCLDTTNQLSSIGVISGHLSGTSTVTGEATGIRFNGGTYIAVPTLTIGRIESGALIEAASKTTAYGIYGYYGNLVIDGDMAGEIKATATNTGASGDAAYGVSLTSMHVRGNLSGTVDASAFSGWVAGVFTNGSFTVDQSLSGRITAHSTSGIYSEFITGFKSFTSFTLHALDGEISAYSDTTTDYPNVYGILSPNVTIDAINPSGRIIASGGTGTMIGLSTTTATITSFKGLVEADAIVDPATGAVGGATGAEIDATAPNFPNPAVPGTLHITDFSGAVKAVSTSNMLTARDAGYATGLYLNADPSNSLMPSTTAAIDRFDGSITAQANSYAAAVYSNNGINRLQIGTSNGTISAAAGGGDVYGVAGGSFTLGSMGSTGRIDVTATNNGRYTSSSGYFDPLAAGVFLWNAPDISDTGTDYSLAWNYWDDNLMIIRNGFNGTVTVRGMDDPNRGTPVSVWHTSPYPGAYGMTFGMYAYNGIFGTWTPPVSPAPPDYTTAQDAQIAGTISASGDGWVVGLGATNGPMFLNVTGTVSAEDRSGRGMGYAILSRDVLPINPALSDRPFVYDTSEQVNDRVTVSGSGRLIGNVDLGSGDDTLTLKDHATLTGNVELGGIEFYTQADVPGNDTLTLSEAANITGNINLGAGNGTLAMSGTSSVLGSISFGPGDDRFTLQGSPDVSGVTLLDGGDGVGDTLTMDGWTSSRGFGGSVVNWEVVQVKNNSEVNLGPTGGQSAPMIFSPSMGGTLAMSIDNTSTVHARGASPSWYEIVGGLVNNGVLDLRDATPAADDHVKVTGAYSGSGYLYLDVALGPDQNTTNTEANLDLLTVGSASGSTTIRVNNTSSGSVVIPTTGSGILLVKVTGTSTSNAFTLDSSNFLGGAQAQLVQVGQSWYLVVNSGGVTGTASVVIPVVPVVSVDPVVPGVPVNQMIMVIPAPEGNRVAQVVSTMIPMLGLDAMPRFLERQAYGWSAPGQNRVPSSWWSRTTGSRFIQGQESGGQQVRVKGYRSSLQVGSDLRSRRCGQAIYRTGVFAGTGYLKADSRSVDVVNTGSEDVFTLGIGGYTSVECRGHWYLEGVVQANEYDINAKFSDGTTSSAGTWGLGVSAEGGAYVKVNDCFLLTPQAQFMWQRIAGYGLKVDRDNTFAEVRSQKGVTGRLGVTGTVMPEGWCMNPLVELNAVRDFGETPEVAYASTGQSYGVKRDRTWLGGSLGIVSRNRYPECLVYYAKVGMMAGVDGQGGRDYTITVGIRKSW